MPRGDGTGPTGQGPGTGRGQGRGRGRGRMGCRGAGSIGYCICRSCGERVMRESRLPCSQIVCPKCGTRMTQE
jgi:hypothetical protein